MSLRARLALTILLAGLATALALILTVAAAFQRFEHESTWERANGFVGRVVQRHPDLLALHARDPEGFADFLRNLLLFETGTQLYLLAPDGTVLASSVARPMPPGLRVQLAPVREAIMVAGDRARAAYVMGDDPEHMRQDTVIAARPLQATTIRSGTAVAGYLYLVCQKAPLPPGRLELLRSSVAMPALAGVALVVLLGSLIAVWIITTVTRPLRELSDEVERAGRDGFEGAARAAAGTAPIEGDDEIARLSRGFRALLTRLLAQWDQLRRLDHFRREGVSNLSHDLRSPLTATVACLETLETRWAADPARADDRALLQRALRNTHDAARLVRSLGDLALLDEPTYRLQTTRLDVGEVLDDIALRFAERAAQQGVQLACPHDPAAPPPVADVDIELLERALANLVDNALQHTPAGGRIVLEASTEGREVALCVTDDGAGIPAEVQPHLFDRFFQARQGTAPAGSEGGRGLGLAIVRRIAELHGGRLVLSSAVGHGTAVSILLPRAP